MPLDDKLRHGIATPNKTWNLSRVTVIADDKSRVQLRHWQVQPGDVWSVEASGPSRLVLTKLEPAQPQRNLLEHLRDLADLEVPERRVHCPPRA